VEEKKKDRTGQKLKKNSSKNKNKKSQRKRKDLLKSL
jgi:hypothetical protein